MPNNKRDIDFGRKAASYDESKGNMSRLFYNLLLSQVELKAGANVIDVACGTGTILREMADTCPINGFGIDMSQNMVDEAKRKCPEMDIQDSRCEATPFADNTFDIITVCMAYHHFADKTAFINEAARIIKPGGRLYIADPNFPGVIRVPMNAVFRVFNIAGKFYTADEIMEGFAASGFISDGFVKSRYAQVVRLVMPL
ncbi:MAG: class I SAM-dependent methyltransferase [Coriobacteriales bacterium]|jgi:ubiquinone/menaquinone biosynthesis C-methylase UbiE|nr:class I SAM-dependent methyltransferase [Coriobacteriales bacterium]